jgi:muramoyltetrapeptide carboxypeptidase LdcA involved in peptidoglycan recycling
VHAVLALRGGYGCDRLLDRIDPAWMRAHPSR